MRKFNRARAGFTLPELMVAAAVSMLLMLMIGVAFQKCIDSFRNLRAVALMQDKLRSADNVIKRDLAAEHFGGPFQEGYSGPYVRDQRMDLTGWMPAPQGYFEIMSAAPTSASGNVEGTDADGLPSTSATNHSIRFTAKLTGKRQEDWFYAFGPSGQGLPTQVTNLGDPNFNPTSASHPRGGVASRWAEINYFLVANGDLANGHPLYALHRRQRVILTPPVVAPAATGKKGVVHTMPSEHAASYPDLSIGATNVLNTPATVAQQVNRIPWNTPLTGAEKGDDILVTDVVSFEIHANWSTGAGVSATALPGPTSGNFDWPFSPLRAPPGALASYGYRFDTGSTSDASKTINWSDPTGTDPLSFLNPGNNAPLNRVRMNTLQIRIRVWDFNTQTARQMTLVQDI
jgi:type II secretory pathway pseudopilin PulG